MREAPGPKLKNYITPAGLQRLKDEHRFLMNRERPAVTQVVAWAAGNGDRSENADYLYGKRRLRQIDSRIRFLTKRIDAAEVVDPAAPRAGAAATRVFFGATVTYKDAAGHEHVVCIVGIDEVDLNRRYISWMSPLARALMKSARATASSCTRRRRPNTSRSSTSSTRRFRWTRSANRQAPNPPADWQTTRPERDALTVPVSLLPRVRRAHTMQACTSHRALYASPLSSSFSLLRQARRRASPP